MGNREYEKILSTIAESVVAAEGRLGHSIENYSQSVRVLLADRHGQLTHAESGLLRALETIASDALQIAALQAHAGSDHEGARRLLDIARNIHEITPDGTDRS